MLLLLLIILALSGIQLRLRTAGLTSVFVLDASDSIPPAERQRGEDFIQQAVDAMPAGDRAAIVLFGKDALVERLASELPLLSKLASIPISSGTDISAALQLAQAIFPAEGAKRLVLLSDGRQNLGQALQQAELAAASQIELLYYALGGPQGENEALVERLEAPADVRQGEDYTLTAVIQTSLAQNAALRIFADGELIHSQELSLLPGENRVQVQVDGAQSPAGFRRFSAQIVPDADTRLQNNQAGAFTVVHGPPSVLIIESAPGEGQNLASALQAAEMQVERIAPGQTPATLAELAAYDAVILVNVHAKSLPDGAMQALPLFVKDLGKGLLMTGGADSFGAGGYLRTPLEEALPVDMDVRNRDLQANLALVLAVDKSGSMGRCHCDNPDLNQTYTRAEVGQPKVDIAKEAIMRAASALGDQDYLGVVAFDSAARWVLDLAQLVDPHSLEQSIGSFSAAGQTNLVSGVQAAYDALQGVDAKRRHVILMTDGWVHTGDLNALAQKMNDEGITLSVIAAGEGSAQYLQSLANVGGGRFYPATDILNVPDIFLKETVQSVGEYIVEDPFYPLPTPSRSCRAPGARADRAPVRPRPASRPRLWPWGSRRATPARTRGVPATAQQRLDGSLDAELHDRVADRSCTRSRCARRFRRGPCSTAGPPPSSRPAELPSPPASTTCTCTWSDLRSVPAGRPRDCGSQTCVVAPSAGPFARSRARPRRPSRADQRLLTAHAAERPSSFSEQGPGSPPCRLGVRREHNLALG